MEVYSIFGADKIPFSQIERLQNSAPEIIIWAVPVIFAFVLLEVFVSYKQNRKYYDKVESLGSLGLGIGNILISTWIKVVLFYMAVWIYNLVPWRMELNWWTFLPCYILFDFCSYWAHRISHKQRFWWATHVAHHSGEHYNLSVTFRLSWVQYLKIIFLFPVPLMGFHPIIFFITNQIAILFQFWVHTEYIRTLPKLFEYIFATPSNHRVHHGSQEKYIDKNFGATFIFWDRMFGTYQKEEEQVIYGLTENIEHKGNPFYINFHEYIAMVSDVKKAKNWKIRLFYIFGNPSKIAKYKESLNSHIILKRKERSSSWKPVVRQLE
ncbi:sterol desaturase family protein [Chryseotalea sanaruensis]|uniref:Sterol desaturase family protein n=1 Tax=Chryseotalea sanaruensis TaxID=2482724 RepID=A0A401U6H5_9BACT|nr:sterol desaturase family protein [Chryseotalea sanaruensis]GCC50485.1 sterol desaturase family protein [Chryseotalea sanaruensis]